MHECITWQYSYSYIYIIVGSNITGEINYHPLHSVLNANSRGDKIFQGDQIYQKICSGGPNILIYLDLGELKMGGPLSRDRSFTTS